MIRDISYLQTAFNTEIERYRTELPDDALHAPIRYILTLGGKRIRPVLVMLAGEAFGAGMERTLPAALAVEVFHNFSLVHDDIMDEAPLRRGKTTVHERWNRNAAILSGDAMLIEAYKQLSRCGVENLPALLHLFNTTAAEVCLG
ncbi:MAG: polyprenyl synthetase family protein, partial [Flavobacteriales bacterium]|nr:polyprenyl synthetase family protein [Flavobacteriales bacterium]